MASFGQVLTFFIYISGAAFKTCTFSGLKTNVMKFLNVSKHKWISPVVSQVSIVRSDSNIRLIRHTDDDTNAGIIAVCCGIEHQVVAPCAIFVHAS